MNKLVGNLFIIAAASGTGKTSLVTRLLQTLSGIMLSVSHTTRPQRATEHNGEHYHFVNNAEFENMIATQQFVEYANVFGYYYGTSKEQLERKLATGNDVILEIDWQGAVQIRKKCHAVSIFILPPSITVLAERLKKRNQDKPDVITKRLAQASLEITHYQEFDFLIVNDDFTHALQQLITIIQAERLRQARQSQIHAKLLEELTKKS